MKEEVIKVNLSICNEKHVETDQIGKIAKINIFTLVTSNGLGDQV